MAPTQFLASVFQQLPFEQTFLISLFFFFRRKNFETWNKNIYVPSFSNLSFSRDCDGGGGGVCLQWPWQQQWRPTRRQVARRAAWPAGVAAEESVRGESVHQPEVQVPILHLCRHALAVGVGNLPRPFDSDTNTHTHMHTHTRTHAISLPHESVHLNAQSMPCRASKIGN